MKPLKFPFEFKVMMKNCRKFPKKAMMPKSAYFPKYRSQILISEIEDLKKKHCVKIPRPYL